MKVPHVGHRVVELLGAEGAAAPVRQPLRPGQLQREHLTDQVPEAARVAKAGEAREDLWVHHAPRPHPRVPIEQGQVHGRRMHEQGHPGQRGAQWAEIGGCPRIDDQDATGGVPDLHQEQLGVVAVFGVELRVDGHRWLEGGQGGVQVVDDQGCGLYQAVMLLLLACTSAPARVARPPGDVATADDADLVAAFDGDGDGVDELVTVLGSTARWPGGEQDLGGAPQRATRGTLDGEEVALVASGMDRDHKGVPARVWAIGPSGARVVYERATPRAQIPSLEVIDGRLWVAVYADSFLVEGGWVDHGVLEVVASGRLAEAQLPVGDQTAVGRVYGDEPRSDGDLTLQPSGRLLATFRGVRSLELADVNHDGAPDLLVADGWHSNYGQVADGRVLLLRGPDFVQASVVAHLGADYAAEDMVLQGDDILVTGPVGVHLLRRDEVGWVDFSLGDSAGNAVFVSSPEGPAVFIAGHPSRVVKR